MLKRGRWTTEYLEDFITTADERNLLEFIAALEPGAKSDWFNPKRGGRVANREQYDFGAGYPGSRQTSPADPVPRELIRIRERIEDHCGTRFDQLIVTRYPPSAGIGRHTDHADAFLEPIAGLSVGSRCTLTGILTDYNGIELERVHQRLDPRSLHVLRGAERWWWEHQIPGARGERCSLTLRVLSPEGRAQAGLPTA